MGQQLNLRQERFCQLLARGEPARQAYPRAGYKRHPANPSRLSANESVKSRLAELQAQMTRKTRVTIGALLDNLAADRETALKLGQPAAAIAATALQAKLLGCLIKRQVVDLSAVQSEEEIVEQVRRELGDDAADRLLVALGRSSRALPAAGQNKPSKS